MRLPGVLVVALGAAAAAGLAAAASWRAPARADAPVGRRPVVLELFSSEGCSSCPPADRVLARLARDQPVVGAEVIALELHVDYWNQLGWTDPFSSAANTERQRSYADALGERGVYTPELVVDGTAAVVGSNEAAARALIAAAARVPKAQVRAVVERGRLSITVADLPDRTATYDVWLAITEEGLVTPVPRGENAGARLAHGPVARTLDRVAAIATPPPGVALAKDVALSLDPAWRRDALQAVVLVQRRGSLAMVGAASAAIR
jgi:hypothetical protein